LPHAPASRARTQYRRLLGGEAYEPKEENPMLGFRGASRYYSDEFADAFGLECAAMKHARDVLGLTNIELMIPFVRTEEELRRVLALMASHGLRRGDGAGDGDAAVAAAANGGDGAPKGMRIHIMCEIPANALLADRFLALCDGFSIGACALPCTRSRMLRSGRLHLR
jgi:pyruvate,water dikinase